MVRCDAIENYIDHGDADEDGGDGGGDGGGGDEIDDDNDDDDGDLWHHLLQVLEVRVKSLAQLSHVEVYCEKN